MVLALSSVETSPDDVAAIGVPFRKGPFALWETHGLDAAWLAQRGFSGNAGQTESASINGRTVVAIGLGEESDIDAETFRRATALFVRSVSKLPSAVLHLPAGAPISMDPFELAQAMAEGALLAMYRFSEYKSQPELPRLENLAIVGADAAGLARGTITATAVALARDLVNQPPGRMTPRRLAEVATEVAGNGGLGITVLDETAIEAEGLGGLRGVSLGSAEPPRLIELTYEPPGGAEASLALVGKGITFDSGGLSLKSGEAMMTMKTDMSGAAAVLATMSVVAELQPPTRVVGIICATENLPGPRAIKPGDVLRARNGKTMEVLNTDAEGRLVLADGLSLAVEADVDAIVDIATLTGACVVALGGEIAGLMSNSEALRASLQSAAASAGEEVWPLPLPKRYRKHIDSEIADIKNIGAPKGAAGALTAGLFLAEFAGDVPWAHLDIAGPARAEGDDAHISRGGTGFGVRTLIELVNNFSASDFDS